MELIKTDVVMRCDIPGCKNLAKYALRAHKVFRVGNLYFCEDCLKSLYSQIGQYLVPKSINNINKKIKIKGIE